MSALKMLLLACAVVLIAADCNNFRRDDDDDDGGDGNEALDAARRLAIVTQQASTNMNCNDFRTLFLNRYLEPDAKWFNPGVGLFVGHSSIDEYYQLVLELLPGVCGNALGFQLTKLDTTPMPTSIVKVSPNSYEANYHLDAFFGPLPPFDGNTWAFPSHGHYFKGFYNFTECSDRINYLITEDLGSEVLFVGDVLAGGQQVDPVQWCGLMSVAQNKYFAEEGYNPANVTGFDFFDPNGFADCFAYHAFLTAKGAVCGTNLVDHTAGCFLRHILTYLTNGASPGHANHWAKLSHGNTKCLDTCEPVLATCHPNANPIPGNTINQQAATFDYFCRCPVGFAGNGVDACDPVTCVVDSDCKPNRASYCDSSDGLCKPLDTFSWNPLLGKAECPEGHKAWYNTTTDRFDCVRTDKCWDVRECPQEPPRVSCVYPGNLASPFGVCQCNPGYDGGYGVECTCPEEKEEEDVSDQFKVCLAHGECTTDDHCEHDMTCSSSHYNEIGLCQ